jgi:uncharacterized membrane protein
MATHALDEINKTTQNQPAGSATKRRLGRITHTIEDFLMAQWATMITLVLGTIVLVALAIPFLAYLGLDSIAKPLFFSLHYICAQIPAHSFYILGHQLGLCARNLAIYSSMFVGSLIFVLSKKRLPGIPWWLWVLLCLPMAWDGFTQMFGLRESTWELRVITGTLFGLGSVWFVLPLMHTTLLETASIPSVPIHHVRNQPAEEKG